MCVNHERCPDVSSGTVSMDGASRFKYMSRNDSKDSDHGHRSHQVSGHWGISWKKLESEKNNCTAMSAVGMKMENVCVYMSKKGSYKQNVKD